MIFEIIEHDPYYLIHKNATSHIDFDLEEAKKRSNENPVYYIQYLETIKKILRYC